MIVVLIWSNDADIGERSVMRNCDCPCMRMWVYLCTQVYAYVYFFLLWPSRDSSVGRAADCRGCAYFNVSTKSSVGHWFDSGSREYILRVHLLLEFRLLFDIREYIFC
jgi:hypothetical protein